VTVTETIPLSPLIVPPLNKLSGVMLMPDDQPPRLADKPNEPPLELDLNWLVFC